MSHIETELDTRLISVLEGNVEKDAPMLDVIRGGSLGEGRKRIRGRLR